MDNVVIIGNNNQLIVAANISAPVNQAGGAVIQAGGAMSARFLEMLCAAERRNADLLNRLCNALEENTRLRLALAGTDSKQ